MKVTLLYSKYLTDPTGASAVMRFLKQGKERFNQNGVDIEFFTRDDILPQKNSAITAPKKSFSGKLKARLMASLLNASKTNPFAALLHKYIYTGRAAKIIVKKYLETNLKDDIVFIHELGVVFEYLKSRKSGDNTKIVLVLHDNGITNEMTWIRYPSLKKPFFYKRMVKKDAEILSNIDKLGYVSEMSMQTFIANNPNYPSDKLFFNMNGIPELCIAPEVHRAHKTINICCIGTVNERKGQKHLVEALNCLSDVEKNLIRINIVGNGEIKDELESYCKKNDLTRYITFLGNRNDIENILSQNDIFILPSHNEGLPIAILEAMRQGLPIVASNVGGIPETVIDGKTGLLIEPSTEGVLKVFKNISQYDWQTMGQESKKLFVSKFSLNKMVDKYSAVFHELEN